MKICIICGHGAGDPGAVSKTYGTEADLVRKLAPKVKAELEKYKDVVATILDTSRNHYQYLKTHDINFAVYDYVIELHANAGAKDPNGNGATTGIEIWVTPREARVSVEQDICKQIATLGLKNRGVKKAEFFVINCVKNDGVSSCLIENGFIDDKDDMEIVTKQMDKYAEKLALGVANGFGLTKVKTVSVGSMVKVASNAVVGGLASNRGQACSTYLKSEAWKVSKIQTNKGVQEALLEGANTWVAIKYLTVA